MYYHTSIQSYNTKEYFNMNKYNIRKNMIKRKKQMKLYKAITLSNYNISCLHSPMVYRSLYNGLRTCYIKSETGY